VEEHKSEASTEAHVEEDVSLMSAPVDVEETDTDAGDQLEVMDKREEEAEEVDKKDDEREVVDNKKEESEVVAKNEEEADNVDKEESKAKVVDKKQKEAEVNDGESKKQDKVLIIAQETVKEKATNGVKDSETEEEEEEAEEKVVPAIESNEVDEKLAKPLQTVSGALELHFEVKFDFPFDQISISDFWNYFLQSFSPEFLPNVYTSKISSSYAQLAVEKTGPNFTDSTHLDSIYSGETDKIILRFFQDSLSNIVAIRR